MPPRVPLAWRCPQCTLRSFSTTTSTRQLGPEHPRYIPIPEPPQQTLPNRPHIKGRLPVPRDVFAGAQGRDKADPEWMEPHTQPPKKQTKAEEGSREAWKSRLSKMRRRNLQEGLTALRARRTRDERMTADRRAARNKERDALLSAPEREDERLTAPSHALDLETLFSPGPLPDPGRAERNVLKSANLAALSAQKRHERFTHLSTLYNNARSFIVTPAQLDAAVEEAFGTEQNPVVFGLDEQTGAAFGSGTSVWASGKPDSVQDMLNRANGVGSRTALGRAGTGTSAVNAERIRRIAEVLTGGVGEAEGSEDNVDGRGEQDAEAQ